MTQTVSRRDTQGVAIVTIENPPVNALSTTVVQSLKKLLQEADDDPRVLGIVLIGAGRSFVAGADIREFAEFTSGRKQRGEGLHPLLNQIENSPKPYVCAVQGMALGAGLELAMACHFRVALQGARFGLPEIKLGLIPGAGGTQRLPRLVGLIRAAEMCATAVLVEADDALQEGLVDQVCTTGLRQLGVRCALELAARPGEHLKTSDRAVRVADGQGTGLLGADSAESAQAFVELHARIARTARGAAAPIRAIEAVQAAGRETFARGISIEAEIFQDCLFSEESKALVHLFFGERQVRKLRGSAASSEAREIAQAAVVGAGTMGRGIAMAYANAGIPVIMKEQGGAVLTRSMELLKSVYEKAVQRGRMTAEEAVRRTALVTPTLQYEGFERADIVVEAVYEGMDLKRQVFAELDRVARPGAILASNTSTLDIDAIASATKRPEAVIGHHFFSPAAVMRLLEIVAGQRTADEVIATSMRLAQRLRKVGVLVGNCRGFVGNRMYGPYQREAQFLVEEGVAVADVDAALVAFGMAMGPLAVADLAGIDVGWRIRQEYQHLDSPNMRTQTVADRLYQLGRFGQKTGRGWYQYPEGDRVPFPDPSVEDLARQCALESGIERRPIEPPEVVERTLYALVNEGARILEEGYARSATDIDIVYVNGYGFPAHRGGPMWYADQIGLERILARVRDFEARFGFWWKPAPLLEQLVAEGRRFADVAPSGEKTSG